MKRLTIILLSIVFVGCNDKPEIQAHNPKWQWIYHDHSGGFCIDTSLCSADLRVGDTVFVIRKIDGSVVLRFIYPIKRELDSSRIKNEYVLSNVKFYNGPIATKDTAYTHLTKNKE